MDDATRVWPSGNSRRLRSTTCCCSANASSFRSWARTTDARLLYQVVTEGLSSPS